MQTLKMEKTEAIKLYKNVPDWFQKTLESTFGPECFSGNVIDRIKTFEDACHEVGENHKFYDSVMGSNDVVAYMKLKVIIKAINEGWEPDWNNDTQAKWYPYFKLSSGFGFSYTYYGYSHTRTTVGSRLCFETKEKCEYVAKQFIDLYETFLTLK